MTHLTESEANELRRLCDLVKAPVETSDEYQARLSALCKLGHAASRILDELAELRAERDEARASIAWVNELNPSTNYESDGAIVHITFEEFDAMRACLGLRPAHRGKEKSKTVSRRWYLEMISERDEAREALRVVQNAAKTLGCAQNAELAHLRENYAFDHRLRAEHESLQARDVLMTETLLKTEADRDGARTALALSNASLTAIVERAQCAERENRELKTAIKSALWRLSTDQDRSGTVVLLRTVLKDDQK